MNHESFTFVAVLAVYLVAITGIGIWGYLRTTSQEEFLVAGRTIGPWVGGAVLAATQISAGTFVGTLGRHYFTGVSWIWIWFGLWSGWVVSAMFVAPKLRRFGALTVADYIGQRFASAGARTLTAALIIICYTILLTAQFQAMGEVSVSIFGIPPVYAMLALMASTAFYTLLGGVRASSYIEFLQTLVMLLGLVMALPVVIAHNGGIVELGRYLTAIDPRITGWWFSWQELVAFGIAFGFSIAAAPYEMTRYYSMRDEQTTRYAIGISMAIQAIIGISVMTLGMGMRGLFPVLPSPDQASSVLASSVMSPLLGSLFLVGMLSAIMSTVNSILLVTGGTFAHDIYSRHINQAATEKQLLLVNRVAIVLLALVPLYVALQKLGDVQAIVVEQAKFVASFFFVPVVLGLNWRRGTRQGAIAAMAGGFIACLGWTMTLQRSFASHGIDSAEVGVAVSAILFVVVSRMTPPTPEENLRIFFGEQAEETT